MSHSQRSASRPPRPKDTLFCPECGHESDVDGDWITAGDGDALVCPDCGAVVVAQPSFGVPV